MSEKPLMPKATAVWLVDNTALTFDQIAEFCGVHPLEVSAIADDEAAQGIKGMDPVNHGQLTRDEIVRCEGNPKNKLKLSAPKVVVPPSKRKGPRYTPLSKRQDRPNAILWLVRNHPELKDSQVGKLLGTTKGTIQQIRDRSHWNSSNLQPMDPVALGLCSQIDLDLAVSKAAKDLPKVEQADNQTLLPATETENIAVADGDVFKSNVATPVEEEENEAGDLDADSVFAKLKSLKGKVEDDEDDDA